VKLGNVKALFPSVTGSRNSTPGRLRNEAGRVEYEDNLKTGGPLGSKGRKVICSPRKWLLSQPGKVKKAEGRLAEKRGGRLLTGRERGFREERSRLLFLGKN